MLLVIAAATTAADAQPRPRVKPTFGQPTSFSACSKTTLFACGMRDSSGHTYGTAKERTVCTTYAFLPDGTYSVSNDSLPSGEHGTYRIHDGKVKLTYTPDGADVFADGVVPVSVELPLSADGDTLGGMTRIPRRNSVKAGSAP